MAEFLSEKDSRILDLDTRKNVYNIVRKFAGAHFRDIERRSKLPAGTVKYHLSYLAKHGLIKEEKKDHNLRYFPREFNSSNKKILGLLRQESVRRILLFILSCDDCNHEQIVQHIGLSPSTVSWHLKKLEKNSIISFVKDGRKTFYNVLADKDEIIKLLITYRESFLDTMVDRVIDMWDIG